MSESQRIADLLVEAGPLMSSIREIEALGDQLWFLSFAEGVGVSVELFEESNKLTLAAEVGPIPAEERLDVYEQMLAYNSLWQDTDGVTLALDSATQTALIHYSFYANELDATSLTNLLDSFVAKTIVWREMMQLSEEAETKSIPVEDATGPGLRV